MDVVGINVLFMKPSVTNFFHDHGVVNVVLKRNFVSFWRDYGTVNVLENYKNIFFFLKPRVVNVVAKWTVNGVPHDIQIFFSFPYDHTQESYVVNVAAVVMT